MNWKIHLYRAILWLITLSLLLMMFGFSAQEGVQSGSISGKIARPITDSLAQRQGLTGQAYWKLYAQVDFAVRKTAHFLEYTLLGLLLTLLLDSYCARWHWLSWAGCTLYAATDEIHQLFRCRAHGQVAGCAAGFIGRVGGAAAGDVHALADSAAQGEKAINIINRRQIMLTIEQLYDLNHTLAADYLRQFTYPWEALVGIKAEILRIGAALDPAEYTEVSEHVWVHKTATVAPTAYLGAPCIIGARTEVRHCAFIRGSALVGADCVVGNSVELKNVILF